jgi:hypothetical protein
MRFIFDKRPSISENRIVEIAFLKMKGLIAFLIWRNRDKPFARCRPGEDLKPSCPCPILRRKVDELREIKGGCVPTGIVVKRCWDNLPAKDFLDPNKTS